MQTAMPWRPLRVREDAVSAWRDGAAWLALLAAGTALSWLATGQVFGAGNNVFHLPIVHGLATLPQFADDAFVQSLHGFSSGLWMLLEGSAAWIAPPLLFGLLLAASKMLSLLAMALIAGELGVTSWPARCGFVALVAVAPLLVGTAYAGHGGLFIGYFSHSELGNGIGLLALWACLRQRFDWALAALGLLFFVNAFMAVWSVLPWAWLGWRALRAEPTLWRRQAGGLGLAALAAAALAAPVLLRLRDSGLLAADATAAFDQRDFLRAYYPYHFLADAMPATQWLGLAVVVVVAVLALRALGPRAAPLGHALAAFGVVYAAGLVLPFVSSSPALLNLHLLRVSVLAHFIAAIALAALCVQWAGSTDARQRRLGAPWLVWCLLAPRPMLLGALLLPWARRRSADGAAPAAPWLRTAGAALLLAGLAVQAALLVRSQHSAAALRASVADWTSLAAQLERSTPVSAVVMLPLQTEDWSPPDAGTAVFESVARRAVWVDHKRGAAVLWARGYHAQWQQRMTHLAALRDWPQRLDFAAAHGIAVVVDRCEGLPAALAGRLLARAGRLCAVAAAPRAP